MEGNCATHSESMNGGTVHVIATSLEGTRHALDAATALARGVCGRVLLFVWRLSPGLNVANRDVLNETEDEMKHLSASYTPRPTVLSCVCERTTDVVQLFQSPGLVVIGGHARLWWPTPEQRLARALERFGCHVTFVHVPRGRFVSPLLAAARQWASGAAANKSGAR
jgi:hypothetical protein